MFYSAYLVAKDHKDQVMFKQNPVYSENFILSISMNVKIALEVFDSMSKAENWIKNEAKQRKTILEQTPLF